jgi:putative endopeptidase
MRLADSGKPDPMIDGMTRDQRFFYGWSTTWRSQVTPEQARVRVASDPHSPARVRANAPPTNVPAFAAAFGCKSGDPMMHEGDALVVIW